MLNQFEFSKMSRAAAVRIAPVALAVCMAPTAMAQTAMPQASPAEAMPAQRVVIDPVTGRLRMAEPSEMSASPVAAPGAASTATPNTPNASTQAASKATGSGVEAHPAMKRMQSTTSEARMGVGVRRFDASSLQFSVVKRSADGKLSTECVHGDGSAHDAVHSQAPGGSHDH